ncbi:MAG: hypothetical protein FWG07_11350 [Treponema sp.]|nr:hypothetical protein [Treponema sp.]
MTALFTIGNILVLSISLFVIFVLRYMDRQNRSVDLAREYGRRLKDDIAAFAEEKAAEVKDNGLVLDVQKSAVKEALNRLAEANAELNGKSGEIMQRKEEINRIGERIITYDKSMEELIRITNRVKEDVGRLKEESVFVVETAKKIDGIKTKAGELEKDFNGLELRFERENTARLEKAVNNLIVQADGKVEDLRSEAQTIERQVEEHRAAIDRIESERKNKLEKDLSIINLAAAEALEKAKNSASVIEGEALEKYREEAMQRVHQFQDNIEGKLAEYRTDQSAQWKRFESLADDALKLDSQLRQTMEAAEAKLRSDLVLFEEEQKNEQARVSAVFVEESDSLKRQMTVVEQEFNILKKRAYDNVSEKLQLLEDDFFEDLARRNDDIDIRLKEFHSNLEKRLVSLEETAETERHNLEQSFKETINTRIEEQGLRIHSELESLKLKTDAFQDRIQNGMDQTESRLSGLNSNAEEIRRGLKDFSSQTMLFEKAEELKTSLDRSMETLRANLSGIEERRAEATRLETEFIKLRRLEDEVNAKMTRFLSEKNRLDIMEKDFERLMQTSQRVEEKLKEATVDDDRLQNLQVSQRKLEDTLAATEEKYQRVENKKHILEETNSSIERNFEMMKNTELAHRKLRENIDMDENRLDSMRSSIENLAAASEKAKYTEGKLTSLNTNLTAIEERIEKMQTAREWLAREETRFEELKREVEKHINVLGQILHDETKKSGSPKGAPPLATREAVIRLRRQGWSTEEIARNLKISPGEVELILETGLKE